MRSILPVTAMALLAALPVVAAPARTFDPIDAKLQAREWEAARQLALDELDRARGSLYGPYLAGVAARLATAEAGLGRTEDAIWHWQVAQSLDREPLSAEMLASFGEPGRVVARHRPRGAGEPPAGVTVYRARRAGDGIQAARKLAGEPPTFSAVVASVPVPKALRVEVIVGTDGRPSAPVVLAGGAPGMIWEALEAVRAWQYEPGRRGDEPVAVFRDIRFDLPDRRPVGELTALSKEAARAEALLRAGSWQQAQLQAVRAWSAALAERQPRRELLAASLAFRALADAGAGSSSSAICRWQAAQHVDERLYGADLTPYLAAGALLDRHRWGSEPAAVSITEVGPILKKGGPVRVPKGWMWSQLRGIALLAATIDEQGGLHQPVIVGMRGDTGADSPLMEFTYAPEPLGFARVGAVAALDALCDWTFAPARAGSRPVSSELVMAVAFGRRPTVELPAFGPVESGNRAAGGPDGWAIIDGRRPPPEVYSGGPP